MIAEFFIDCTPMGPPMAEGATIPAERVKQSIQTDLLFDTFREDSSFKTWVSAIAWRGALSRRRSLSLQWRRFVQPVEVAALEPVTCGPTSEEALIAAEQYRNTTRLIRALPTRLRDPLLLIATGEQSYKEMSAMLGVPEGTLKWRVSEARRLLREKLEKLGCSR